MPVQLVQDGDCLESRTLVRLIREATQLGARFRLSGADLIIDNEELLPKELCAEFRFLRSPEFLRDWFDYEDTEYEALTFSDKLGVEPVLVEDAAGARSAVRQLIADLHHHGGLLGLDIETAPKPGHGAPRPWININKNGVISERQPEIKDRAGLDPHRADIQLVQLYAGGAKCFVFQSAAAKLIGTSHWLRRQHLVVHNAGFETGFLRALDYRRPAGRKTICRLECSMQAAGLLYGFRERSLASAVKNIFNISCPKALQTSDWAARKLSEGQVAYAASDAILAWRLWPILRDALHSKNRWNAYELQRQVIPAVTAMELRGLGFDRDEHARQVEAWSRGLAKARQEFQEITGAAPPANDNQLHEWLLANLDQDSWRKWPKTETGLLSVDAKQLKRLTHIESARPILALRAREKLLSTFGNPLLEHVNPVTGRLHCDYNIAGAKSGRFSSSHPNLQNLPANRAPEFKRCIVAAPGSFLVGCDWSQIELRAAAWISGDAELTQLYAEGRDLHAETAALISGVPLEAVTKDQRAGAKAVNFGAVYGIGARSLCEYAFAKFGVVMSEQDAQQALDRFFRRYRGLKDWRRRNAEICQARGYIEIGVGRVVEAAWEPGGLSFPQCCNLPVQGISADAMLLALFLVHRRLQAAKVRGGICATVHDELLLEVLEADVDVARSILEHTMVEAFEMTFPGAPTKGVAEVSTGRNWMEVKGQGAGAEKPPRRDVGALQGMAERSGRRRYPGQRQPACRRLRAGLQLRHEPAAIAGV